MIEVVYGNEKYFESFHAALNTVAKERIYIEMIEAPPLADVVQYQRGLIQKNGPVYYAIEGEKVVGWCDIFPKDNPRMSHRGSLGMGIIPGYRRMGIGTRLMMAALGHAKKFGFEKVELSVYSNNTDALVLYKKMGFEQEGVVKNYRRLDGFTYDAISMAKDLF